MVVMRYFTLCLLMSQAVAFSSPAPLFEGRALSGEVIRLQEQLKDGRYLLLSFWATWCEPCLEELKVIPAKLREEKNLPIDLLTVNVDSGETSAKVKSTMKLHGFSFPVVMDTKSDVFSKFQLVSSLPYSVLINSKAEIVASFHGYQNSDSMLSELRRLTLNQSHDAK